MTGQNRRTLKTPVPVATATLFTTNPTQIGLRLNPGIDSQWVTTNCLSISIYTLYSKTSNYKCSLHAGQIADNHQNT